MHGRLHVVLPVCDGQRRHRVGRTIALALPSRLKVQREKKHVNVLQYGKRVWSIRDDGVDVYIAAAVATARAFF